MTARDPTRLNLSAVSASVAVAAILVLAKFWAFAVTGSLAVAASLADSGVDLIVALGGLAAVRYAARPPDADHAFGHSSAEDLAALGQSVFLLMSAGTIAIAAIGRLGSAAPVGLASEGAGIAVMGLAVLLTLGLVAWQTRVTHITGNRVVAADRLHYVGDLLPNLGAIAALWASGRFGVAGLDSGIALVAAAFLGVGAVRVGSGAWDALMDKRADPKLITGIEEIARNWPGVRGFHDLKTRHSGSRVFINLHIELDGSLSLYDAHAIGASLRRAILDAYPQSDVIIHKDPV